MYIYLTFNKVKMDNSWSHNPETGWKILTLTQSLGLMCDLNFSRVPPFTLFEDQFVQVLQTRQILLNTVVPGPQFTTTSQ